ncbi:MULTISPECIES: hypothetical protein [Myroides]|uniref:hypothetical protein n=1 Tax=Myroides TaxID=76831 RepID=UPI001321BCB0|nr:MULTISPECIES: hypothetical protein [Myroides]MVX36556.1 hypothetical protein [Myroides sp. LoEW2-1]UVD81080.1 hypothetical protein NWE55_07475 [Myroides albus]
MRELKYFIGLIVALLSMSLYAQKTTVQAVSYGISDNLDIQAVASIFGQSSDLADFEYRLNDPELRISNLDLNNDGYVDYLRVVEVVENYTHVIIVQAVLGADRYQDVLTIEVEKDNRRGTTYVQFVGNPYFYGPNYIYEPVYYSTPPLFSLFWVSSYRPYHSSWYWNYYPSYYYGYSPYATHRYVTHIHAHIDYNNNYFYHPYRYSRTAEQVYSSNRTTYYEKQNPEKSFRTTYKDAGYTNYQDLNAGRKESIGDYSRTTYSRNSYSNNNANSNNSSYSRTSYSGSKSANSSNYNRSTYSSPSSSSSNYSRSTYSSPSSSSSSNYSRSTYSSPSSSSSGYSRSTYSSPSSSSSSNYSRSSYSSPSSSSSSNYSRPSSRSYSRSSYSSPSSSSSSYSRPSSSSSSSSYSRSSYSSPSSSSSSYSRPSSSSSSSSSRSTYSR